MAIRRPVQKAKAVALHDRVVAFMVDFLCQLLSTSLLLCAADSTLTAALSGMIVVWGNHIQPNMHFHGILYM